MPTVPKPPVPGPLRLPRRVLLGPGPCDVPPRVLEAMGTPLLGHLDPDFVALMDETQDLLRYAFQTTNRLTLAISGTGSAGMETAVVNLIEPGERMLVCVNGYFGERMKTVAERAGAQVTVIERPYGEVFEPDEVKRAVDRVRPKVIGLVHAETSTGAWQPVEEIARVAHDAEALIALDAVTSLGGIPLETDLWEIDAIYSGSQKCLGAPPGLSPVTLGPRALDALTRRKTPVQSWYFDLSIIQRYWGTDRFYHHTAPISMNFALREALALVVEEGLENRIDRHAQNGAALQAGLAAMGLSLATAAGHRLPQVSCIRIPEGIDDLTVRRRLLKDWGIEIGGGLGPFKGQVWRIGLMGHSSRRENVSLVLSALETCLKDLGYRLPSGAGTSAADQVYKASATAETALNLAVHAPG
jgi:alanine-glyoxylate transaminase/serine-glyoxylate transaminase/serine-pyruvate transaminase